MWHPASQMINDEGKSSAQLLDFQSDDDPEKAP